MIQATGLTEINPLNKKSKLRKHLMINLLGVISIFYILLISSECYSAVITTVSYKENDLSFRWLFDYDLTEPKDVPNAVQFHPTPAHDKWESTIAFADAIGQAVPTMFIRGQHLIDPPVHNDGAPAPTFTFSIENPTNTALVPNAFFGLAGLAPNNFTGLFPLLDENLNDTSINKLHKGVKHGNHFDVYSLLFKHIVAEDKIQFHFQGKHIVDDELITISEPSNIFLYVLAILLIYSHKNRNKSATKNNFLA